MTANKNTPWWMIIIIIAAMVPALMLPAVATTSAIDAAPRYLLWFYPAYVLASGVCAYITYPDRSYLSWILIVLLLMSHAAMWLLITQ